GRVAAVQLAELSGWLAVSTLSLHDALPICLRGINKACQPSSKGGAAFRINLWRHGREKCYRLLNHFTVAFPAFVRRLLHQLLPRDRKSTRLNSSHVSSSYAVFCCTKQNRRT